MRHCETANELVIRVRPVVELGRDGVSPVHLGESANGDGEEQMNKGEASKASRGGQDEEARGVVECTTRSRPFRSEAAAQANLTV
jgi:hypothetical protein